MLKRLDVIHDIKLALDVGSGPGTIAIPLARSGVDVIAVEPTDNMIRYLREFARKLHVTNKIEIVRARWPEVYDILPKRKFDLVVCSHITWIFPDLEDALLKISSLSRAWCCIIESASPSRSSELYRKLGVDRILQTFPSYVMLYNVLYGLGFTANIVIVEYEWAKTPEKVMKYLEIFTLRYKGQLTEQDREVIRQYVYNNIQDGLYRMQSRAAIILWHVEKHRVRT